MAADPSQRSFRDGPTGDPSAADKLADSQVRGRADFRRCFAVPRPTGVFGSSTSSVLPFLSRNVKLEQILMTRSTFFLALEHGMQSSKLIYCKGAEQGCTSSYDPKKEIPSSWSGGKCRPCRGIPAASPLSGPRAPDAISPVITAAVLKSASQVRTSRQRASTVQATRDFSCHRRVA